MNGFMNLATFSTFAGMVAAVTLLTQVLKQFTKKINPKWIALFVAGIVVIFVEIVIPDRISYESAFLAFANWLLVTGASIGLFEGGKSVGQTLGIGQHSE